MSDVFPVGINSPDALFAPFFSCPFILEVKKYYILIFFAVYSPSFLALHLISIACSNK